MVIENVTGFEEVLWKNIPGIIMENFGGLITILQAVGIVFLFYFIYLVVRELLTWKRIKRLKRIEEKLGVLEKKIDKILVQKKEKKKK